MSILAKPPTRSFHNRVAIVSGAGAAGSGIGNGRAAAILLAEAGCSVICVDINLESAQYTVDMIREAGEGDAVAVCADVAVESRCKDAVDVARVSTVDLTSCSVPCCFCKITKFVKLIWMQVNIVGIPGPPSTAMVADMSKWNQSMTTNVSSIVHVARYAIPLMLRNTSQWRGSIVNTSSVAGIRGGIPHLFYSTSKGAVVEICQAR